MNEARASSATVLRAARAFARRDAVVEFSYRTPFVTELFSVAVGVLEFFFLAKIVPAEEVPGGYYGFATVGLVVSILLGAGVSGVASAVRQEQIQGTLEGLLASGLPTTSIAAGFATFPMVSASVRAVVYGVVAALIGSGLHGANWGLAIVGLLLGAIAFAGIGIALAALVFIFRRVSGLAALILTLMAFLAGVLFPLTLFPPWLRAIAQLSPATVCLEIVRGALLEGESWSEASSALAWLLLLAVLCVAGAIISLGSGLARARRTGSLSGY